MTSSLINPSDGDRRRLTLHMTAIEYPVVHTRGERERKRGEDAKMGARKREKEQRRIVGEEE